MDAMFAAPCRIGWLGDLSIMDKKGGVSRTGYFPLKISK